MCPRPACERFADHPNVRVEGGDLRVLGLEEHFDSVLMVNVLEHIADDVEALRRLSQLLVPGGNVVVYVPALNGLYGPNDKKVGHYRRYSVWRLREVFREAGLEPVELRWVNLLAIPAWAAFSRGDVRDAQEIGKLLSLWDRTAVPASRFLEAHVRTPIGTERPRRRSPTRLSDRAFEREDRQNASSMTATETEMVGRAGERSLRRQAVGLLIEWIGYSEW